jgi:hypothetical protein
VSAIHWMPLHYINCYRHRMAELHGPKYVKQFARVMWRQCGMRLIVLEAHKDTKAELCIAS